MGHIGADTTRTLTVTKIFATLQKYCKAHCTAKTKRVCKKKVVAGTFSIGLTFLRQEVFLLPLQEFDVIL